MAKGTPAIPESRPEACVVSDYNLRSKVPPKEPAPKGRTTQNSLEAGILDPSDLDNLKKEHAAAIPPDSPEPKEKGCTCKPKFKFVKTKKEMWLLMSTI